MTATDHEPAIPLVDLKAQYAALRPEVDIALAAAVERADYILGSEVQQFETEFAAYCGTRFAVGCGNGTDALYLALRALAVGPGDEVILPAMTFAATAVAVVQAGGKPVLVDIDPHTALIDPDLIEAAVTPRTKVICPVHLYGQCLPMEPILAIARKYGLAVVEDAAQAHGASSSKANNSQRAGSMGDIGCFSFYPGKNLGAYGDGGCLTTNRPELANRLKSLRNLGSLVKYHHEEPAPNSRLDTIQAAVLRVKLPRLDAWNQARRQHARRYDEALHGLPGITFPNYDQAGNYHLYVIRTQERDAVVGRLNRAGIGAGIHYPFAIHQLQAFRAIIPGRFPVAEAWAATCLSLPIYPELPENAAARVAKILGKTGE